MNKDIQALIEREAFEHWSQSNYKEVAEKAHSENDMCKTSAMARKVSNSSFQAGASFALSLFKWIKVSEVLPENINDVLLLKNGKVHQGYYSLEKKSWFVFQHDNMYFRYENITHWMPIPQID